MIDYVPEDAASSTPVSGDTPASESDVAQLLARMRNGDREAAAQFIDRYGQRIRRRLRAKLSPSMRRLFDSQEILSTLARRLDSVVREGKLTADSEPRLWSLVLTISDHALVDKARLLDRLARVEGADGPAAREFRQRLHEAETSRPDGALGELDEVLKSLNDPIDRQVLSMWLNDIPHTLIGEELGMSAAAVRKRWQGIRTRLRERAEGRME